MTLNFENWLFGDIAHLMTEYDEKHQDDFYAEFLEAYNNLGSKEAAVKAFEVRKGMDGNNVLLYSSFLGRKAH